MIGTYTTLTKTEAKELAAEGLATSRIMIMTAVAKHAAGTITFAEMKAKEAEAADYYAARLDFVTERLA
jgi:hypothetical protein